jgi:hypothetical protein
LEPVEPLVVEPQEPVEPVEVEPLDRMAQMRESWARKKQKKQNGYEKTKASRFWVGNRESWKEGDRLAASLLECRQLQKGEKITYIWRSDRLVYTGTVARAMAAGDESLLVRCVVFAVLRLCVCSSIL